VVLSQVAKCCRSVADPLPIKCLIINDVTDVADFQSISSKRDEFMVVERLGKETPYGFVGWIDFGLMTLL
jgi:hypothetical protein